MVQLLVVVRISAHRAGLSKPCATLALHVPILLSPSPAFPRPCARRRRHRMRQLPSSAPSPLPCINGSTVKMGKVSLTERPHRNACTGWPDWISWLWSISGSQIYLTDRWKMISFMLHLTVGSSKNVAYSCQTTSHEIQCWIEFSFFSSDGASTVYMNSITMTSHKPPLKIIFLEIVNIPSFLINQTSDRTSNMASSRMQPNTAE